MTKPILVSTVMLAIGGGALVAAVAVEVRPWKPAGISSPRFESHPAFDPRTGDFYFVRSSPEFRGWRVPDVLLSGDHGRVEEWRREQSRLRSAVL